MNQTMLRRMAILPTLAFASLFVPGAANANQLDLTLSEFLKGDRIPLLLKPGELGPQFMAINITSAGENGGNGLMSLFSNPLMMLGMMGGG